MKTINTNWKNIPIIIILIVAIFTSLRCRKDSCEYTPEIDPPANAGCAMSNSINLSTGIDANNNPISPGKGMVDPFWKLLNNPPLVSCSNTLTSSINGSAYIINFLGSGPTGWVNQPNSSTICPIDLGTTDSFGCNNANNSVGDKVPYVFERPFCVLKDTKVDFNFTYRGDDQLYIQLLNNNTNTVIATSPTFVFSTSTPSAVGNWSMANVPITAGSYSLRAYLTNISSIVLGFSIVGNLTTSAGDLAISNNTSGCCENNTISILNILENTTCNSTFDGLDAVGNGWTFNLKNSAGTIIKTAVTDVNGNIFFGGIADGTYTVEAVPTGGYIPNNPTGGTTTFSISGNTVKNLTFYSCK